MLGAHQGGFEERGKLVCLLEELDMYCLLVCLFRLKSVVVLISEAPRF